MRKVLRGTYTKITVGTVDIAGEDALEVKVEDYGEYVFNVKLDDLDELIKTLEEAKEALDRGRNTNE